MPCQSDRTASALVKCRKRVQQEACTSMYIRYTRYIRYMPSDHLGPLKFGGRSKRMRNMMVRSFHEPGWEVSVIDNGARVPSSSPGAMINDN
jgi:hypothetical protein